MLTWVKRPRTNSHLAHQPIQPPTTPSPPENSPPNNPHDDDLQVNLDIWPSIEPNSSSPSWLEDLVPNAAIFAGLSPLTPARVRTPRRSRSLAALPGSEAAGTPALLSSGGNSSESSEDEHRFSPGIREGKRKREEVSAAMIGPTSPTFVRPPKESTESVEGGREGSFTFGPERRMKAPAGTLGRTPVRTNSTSTKSDLSPSTYASLNPSSPSLSARMTTGEGASNQSEELATRSQLAESTRSVFGPIVPRSVAGGTRASGSDTEGIERERSFDERSWQFRVAEELYSQSLSRRQTETSLVVPSPLRTRTSTPELSPRARRSRSSSHAHQEPRLSITTETSRQPGSSTSSSVRPAASISTHPRSTPPSHRGTVPDIDTTPEAPPGELSRRGSGDNESWHDAEEEIDPVEGQEDDTKEITTTLFDVRPSFRSAVTFETTPLRKSHHDATSRAPTPSTNRRASRTSQYIDPSPRLSATRTIDLAELDPFTDGSEAPPKNSSSSLIYDDEITVVLPFPVAPIASTIPSQYLHSPSNFLSGPPKQLRREWKREQRRSLMARSPSPIQTLQRAASPCLEPRPSFDEQGRPLTPQGEFDQLVVPVVTCRSSGNGLPSTRPIGHHSPHPSLASSINSGWSLPHFMSPLALVPTGAYLFLLGFIFPPFWWIGAFTPRLVNRKKRRDYGGVRLAEVKVEGGKPFGPLTEWPDHREGARRPSSGAGQGVKGGWITRFLDGKQLWEGGVGWQSTQQNLEKKE